MHQNYNLHGLNLNFNRSFNISEILKYYYLYVIKMKTFLFEEENLILKVGNNSSENDKLLNEADQNDIWFHLENMASPHGILFLKNINSDEIPKNILLECAEKIKENSKAKNFRKVSVIYTFRKHIKKTNTLGKVITKKKINKIII